MNDFFVAQTRLSAEGVRQGGLFNHVNFARAGRLASERRVSTIQNSSIYVDC
jgi:hypothetical protein